MLVCLQLVGFVLVLNYLREKTWAQMEISRSETNFIPPVQRKRCWGLFFEFNPSTVLDRGHITITFSANQVIQFARAVSLEVTLGSYGLLEDLLLRARGSGQLAYAVLIEGHLIRTWWPQNLGTVLRLNHGNICLLWLVRHPLPTMRSKPTFVQFPSLSQISLHWLVWLNWLTHRNFHLRFWLSRSCWKRLEGRRRPFVSVDCLVKEDRRSIDVEMMRRMGLFCWNVAESSLG